jgi:hypothetical protein
LQFDVLLVVYLSLGHHNRIDSRSSNRFSVEALPRASEIGLGNFDLLDHVGVNHLLLPKGD